MSTNVGSIHYDLDLKTSKFDQAANKISSKTSSIGRQMTDLGKTLSVGVTLPIALLGGAMIKSASDLEKTAQSFDVLVGNGKKASKLFAEIKRFADTTPFEFPELAKASTTLLGYGISADDVKDRLKRLGDAAAASGGDLNGITLAYAQMVGRGKVTGDNLRQLTENMVTLRDELSKVSGIPMKDLDKAVEDGKISVDMLNEALDMATNKGGKFFGGTDKLAQTFSGRFSTMKDNVMEFGRNLIGVKVDDKLGLVVQEGGIFDRLSDLLPKISEAAGKLGEKFRELSPNTQNLILIGAAIMIALGPVLVILGTLATSIGALIPIFSSPVFWMLAAVMAVIAGVIYLVYKNWDTLKPILQGVIDKLKILWAWFNQYIMPVLKLVWGFVAGQFKSAWNDLKDAFDRVKKQLEPFMPQLVTLAKIFGVILLIPIMVFIGIIVATIAVITAIAIAIARLIGWLAKFIAKAIEVGITVGRAFSGLRDRVIGAVSGFGSLLYDSGKKLIQGLINGIKNMAGNVKEAVSGVLKKARDLLPFSPAKEGPFSGKGYTLYSGMAIMKDFAKGIDKNAQMPQQALDKALSSSLQNTQVRIGGTVNDRVQNPSPTNIYGNVTIGSQQDTDYFFQRLNRSQDLLGLGLAPMGEL